MEPANRPVAPFLIIEDYEAHEDALAAKPSAPSADQEELADAGGVTLVELELEGLVDAPEAVYLIVSLDAVKIRTPLARVADGHAVFKEAGRADVAGGALDLRVGVWAPGRLVAHGARSVSTEELLDGDLSLALQPAGQLHLSVTYAARRGRVSLDEFEKLKVLGRGNFGKVLLVRKRATGRLYAMKTLRKDRLVATAAVTHTVTERNVLTRLRHPFIVPLRYSFQTAERLFLVLDYASGGELFFHLSRVERFSEDRARFYAAEIVLALGYIHSQKLLYRDLKPENLLLDVAGHMCVTDFGLVKELSHPDEKTATFCGSKEYLAPEMLLARPYGRGVDWWALGTLIYEMIAGLPPFFSENLQEMNERIIGAPLMFDEACDLLRRLLHRDALQRLGSGPTDMEELKCHAWFKSVDWTALYERRVEPPFVPPLRHALDVQNFASEFTSEPPTDSYIPPTALAQPRARVAPHALGMMSKEGSNGSVGSSGVALSDGASELDAAFANFSYVAPDLLSLRRKISAARSGSSPSPLLGVAHQRATPSPSPADTSLDARDEDSDEDIFQF